MKVISVNFVPNVNFLLSCIKSDPREYFSRAPVRIQEMVTKRYWSAEFDFRIRLYIQFCCKFYKTKLI